MNASNKAEIERLLGEEMDDALRGTCSNLNELSPEFIARARRLPPLWRQLYLAHYVAEESLRFLPLFIDEVVSGGTDAQTWRRGGYLIPSYPLEELLTLNVEGLLAVLGPRDTDRWLQIAPDREAWEQGDPTIPGAPALARPELNYLWRPDPHVIDVQAGPEDLIPIDDVRITTRRWMASQFASWAVRAPLTGDQTPAACAKAILGEKPPSQDALIAITGFFRERKEFSDDTTSMPGFQGPASWYT